MERRSTIAENLNFMNNPRSASTCDVVIVGAGPVGLFLAAELALARCSVLLLEKAPLSRSPLKQFPFGLRGLWAPAIEALDRRGLLGEFEVHRSRKNPHANAEDGARRPVGHFAGIPFREGDVDFSRWTHRLPSSPPTGLLSDMEEIESVLGRRAEALGVKIVRGIAVDRIEQTDHGVAVRCGRQSFRSRWLVGCDGARSMVRKAGGFEFAGTEPEFTGYSVKAEIADPEKLAAGRNVTPRGMYLQSQPGYLVMQDFDGGAFHHSQKPITREHVQEILRRISGTDVTVTSVAIATTWTDRARQAITYREGRILLAGDAAHIHSPLGGQGLNLGLGDAMNLGWKLAATIREEAPKGLLDTYHNERHPVGAQVLDWSRAQVAVMKHDPAARALHAILRDLIGTRDGATYMAERVWGISAHPLSGEHPLVGRSVPNFELEDGGKVNELMREGCGILLNFHGDASLKTFADEYGAQMKYVSGRAKESPGAWAILVRPDGLVAWASDGEPDEQALRQAAAPWFAPQLKSQ